MGGVGLHESAGTGLGASPVSWRGWPENVSRWMSATIPQPLGLQGLHLSCLSECFPETRPALRCCRLAFASVMAMVHFFRKFPLWARACTGQDRREVRPLPPCRAIPPTHSARGVGAFVCYWLRYVYALVMLRVRHKIPRQ